MESGFRIEPEYCSQIPGAPQINDAVPKSKIEILKYKKIAETGEDRLKFDLIDAPASHANALRRTLLSSVPSVAIEMVGILNNNGVMPDEVLCHRIGLIPINADPTLLNYPKEAISDESSDPEEILLFCLRVRGGERPEGQGEPDFSQVDASMEEHMPPIYVGKEGFVYSRHLIWMPLPGQREIFGDVRPLHDDIPITRILPGQEIHCYCRAIKGIGSDHAKFSPVCTAFYRLVPMIKVDEKATMADKKALVDVCPCHVFEIEDSGNMITHDRKCTTCRECVRNERTKNHVLVTKVANRYEFTVESVGVRPAHVLVKEAFQILSDRCAQLKDCLHEATNQ